MLNANALGQVEVLNALLEATSESPEILNQET
jgi:hypothetical protein